MEPGPSELIRTSRREAGLTQVELAKRLGTTQSAIARLERRGANPRFDTLEKALTATGHQLSLHASARIPSVDESLIARQLRLTPAERLAALEAAYADVRRLAGTARSEIGEPG
jgi:transcriptional regulator with XRE-family HTH domain